MEANMRHAMRAAIRPALTVLLVVCALSCGPRPVKTEFRPLLVDAEGRPSLGYLEHRGEMYDLRDWSLAGHDPGKMGGTFAHIAVGPTIADDGSGFYSVTLSSHTVHVEMNSPVMFEGPFEEPEEDQRVEITTID